MPSPRGFSYAGIWDRPPRLTPHRQADYLAAMSTDPEFPGPPLLKVVGRRCEDSNPLRRLERDSWREKDRLDVAALQRILDAEQCH